MVKWTNVSQVANLPENATHIWLVKMGEQLENLTYFQSILSDEEKSKVNNYKFSRDQQCSIISRACLRIFLGCYFDSEPSLIRLKKTKYGKPFLRSEPNIYFNVSHTNELVLYSFTKIAPIGIDVEYIEQNLAFHDLSNMFFAKNEINKLKELDGEELRLSFFRCWTRKEAFVKAVGEGLSFPLNKFEVTLLGDEPVCVLSENRLSKKNWSLHSFTPRTGYESAVVQQGEMGELSYFSLMI